MEFNEPIYVAGHRGLVGSAIIRQLRSAGYENLICATHAELDLCEQQAVRNFFKSKRPRYVFLAAAKVGGIAANSSYPADFIYQNLQIASNIIDSARSYNVAKLINLGSSCIYPRLAAQPLREDSLLSAALEPTNEAYAVAKIAAIKLCHYYNHQYATNFISVMPPNLYGSGDNFDLETSHFLPALIRKMSEAQRSAAAEVVLWGDGSPYRELLHSDDLACALLYLMENAEADQLGELINVGSGEEHSIAAIAAMVAEVVGYSGRICWDSSRPSGTPRKLLDVSRIRAMGWQPQIPLLMGIEQTYREYLKKYVKE